MARGAIGLLRYHHGLGQLHVEALDEVLPTRRPATGSRLSGLRNARRCTHPGSFPRPCTGVASRVCRGTSGRSSSCTPNDEELRYGLRIEERLYGRLCRGPERPDVGKDVVLQHELSSQRRRLRRVVLVVQVGVFDLSAVHPAVSIHPAEHGVHGRGNFVITRSGRPSQRDGGANSYARGRHPWGRS